MLSKKTMYDKLITKVNAIDTSAVVEKRNITLLI